MIHCLIENNEMEISVVSYLQMVEIYWYTAVLDCNYNNDNNNIDHWSNGYLFYSLNKTIYPLEIQYFICMYDYRIKNKKKICFFSFSSHFCCVIFLFYTNNPIILIDDPFFPAKFWVIGNGDFSGL